MDDIFESIWGVLSKAVTKWVEEFWNWVVNVIID